MAVAQIHSRAQLGLSAPRVRVEVHVGGGLPNLNIVGLPAPAVRESRERVRAALVHCGYDFPAGRITVNLAPADLPKEGCRFDLAIALGILVASGQLRPAPGWLERCEVYGELGLTGALEAVPGLMVAALAAGSACPLLAPAPNAAELAQAGAGHACLVSTLPEACAAMVAGWAAQALPVVVPDATPAPASPKLPDLAMVRGLADARNALVVAAAGGHSLLMVGPPGAGKSLLAQCLPGLLPPLAPAEARQVAALHSLGRRAATPPCLARPFRSPHHTASAQAIVGGGAQLSPGEISLAHRGVLFLDELPEFDRRVLESLREPLETGVARLARAGGSVEYPADFQLVAAMNPCPCGYAGTQGDRACRCARQVRERYRQRLSGPLLDRIDIALGLQPATTGQLLAPDPQPRSSATEAVRVEQAWQRQRNRQGCLNARLAAGDLERACRLEPQAQACLQQGATHHGLSARAVHRVLRVALTLADLDGVQSIDEGHVASAMAWRAEGVLHPGPARHRRQP
jgi:magnesium chelatase family protein